MFNVPFAAGAAPCKVDDSLFVSALGVNDTDGRSDAAQHTGDA